MKRTFPIIPLLAGALALSSCQKEGPGQNEENVTTGEATFLLGHDGGSSGSVSVEFADAWEVTGVPSWCTVSPMGGEAGTVEFTVTAGSGNGELKEREDVFRVRLASSEEVEYWVIQRGTPGMAALVGDLYALASGEAVEVGIEGNGLAGMPDIDTGADWVSVVSVEVSVPAVLGDGRTESEYYTGKMLLSVDENTGAGARSCTVSAVGGGGIYSI